MNILITGGRGLIGQALVKKLQDRNHTVRILTRKQTRDPIEYIWDIEKNYVDDRAFENLDAIIHLAGANISRCWTDSYKKELFTSRIASANLLKDYCLKHKIHLKSFISASGINYYGTFTSDELLSENSEIIHSDFLTNLCLKWEASAHIFSDISDRIVCMRTAMVLAKEGGALPVLKKIADLHLASAIGSGQQWMNWIHVEDLAEMYVYALENHNVNGAVNAVADQIPTNEEFMKTLAEINGKIFLRVNIPYFIIKMLFGEMSSIILEGTRACNEKIKSLGFDFKYTEIKKAFNSLEKLSAQ